MENWLLDKENKTATFNTEIFLEYSFTKKRDSQGKAYCSMELFPKLNTIEWIITYKDESEDVVHIGVWFDEINELIEYDGVFSLPKQAIRLLRELGYGVDEEFEN